MSELLGFEESDRFSRREKAALRYTEAILWNPQQADDALWRELHEEFTEPEIVEIGFWAGFTSGGQRWLHTLHTRQGELAAYMEGRQPAKRSA